VKIWRLELILLALCLVSPNRVYADTYSITYTYDLVGNRLYRTVVANGQTIETEYQYYSDGLAAPIDSCKVTTITEYDDAGRISRTLRDISDTTGTLRDISDTTGSIEPNTVVLSQTCYNSIGKVDWSADEYGSLTEYDYDELGNLVETRAYDPYNNLLTISRTLYDVDGRVLVTVDTHEPGQVANSSKGTHSCTEPRAMMKKCLRSDFVNRPLPSAMLADIDSEARLSWSRRK